MFVHISLEELTGKQVNFIGLCCALTNDSADNWECKIFSDKNLVNNNFIKSLSNLSTLKYLKRKFSNDLLSQSSRIAAKVYFHSFCCGNINLKGGFCQANNKKLEVVIE